MIGSGKLTLNSTQGSNWLGNPALSILYASLLSFRKHAHVAWRARQYVERGRGKNKDSRRQDEGTVKGKRGE